MPSANTTEAIDGLTTAIQGMGATFLLICLFLVAVFLTWAMFQSKSSMLGFPCTIFWAILGGDAYLLSLATWDIHYFIFFGSMGMAVFSAFAAYGLRTKKEEMTEGDEFIDEGEDDVKFIDDGKSDSDSNDNGDGEKPSRRIREVRERANKRRTRWE